MKRFYTFLQLIALQGVNDTMRDSLQKNIILCNLMSIVLIFTNSIYLIVDIIRFGHPLRSITTICIIFIAIFSIYLNRIKLHHHARILSSFIYSLLVFGYGLIIKFAMQTPDLIHYISPRMPLIMFVFFPFLFLDVSKERIAFIFTFVINVCIVVFFDPIHWLLRIDMASFGLHLNYYHVLTQNSITFLINISMGFTFLKIVNQLYEKRIIRLNRILRQKNLRIQHQNQEIKKQMEELSQQREEISSLNNHLEHIVLERTEKLQIRNKQLSDYAFFNAHKLRAPVATILGLFEVMKMENHKENENAMMQHFYKTVQELDEVVKQMQRTVDTDD